MTENSLITLYCIVDDFIHRFLGTSAGKKNLAMYYGKRGPKRRMPVADVVTLNLIRVFDRTGEGNLHRRRHAGKTLFPTFLFHLVEDAMPWFLPYFNSVTKLEF